MTPCHVANSLTASLIGAPTDIGAGARGASMGPEALRVAGIREALAAHGLHVNDLGNLSGPTNPWQPPAAGYRHLPETAKTQHSPFDRTTQALVIQLSFKQHDPDNLHQIARAIHAQPCGVDVGNTFVGRHCSLQKDLKYL